MVFWGSDRNFVEKFVVSELYYHGETVPVPYYNMDIAHWLGTKMCKVNLRYNVALYIKTLEQY